MLSTAGYQDEAAPNPDQNTVFKEDGKCIVEPQLRDSCSATGRSHRSPTLLISMSIHLLRGTVPFLR